MSVGLTPSLNRAHIPSLIDGWVLEIKEFRRRTLVVSGKVHDATVVLPPSSCLSGTYSGFSHERNFKLE